ncbi:MAG: TM0106 family RecB-like putative nuclease [Candidatus Obscuribacterales bacterium]|nr:TM0106 family RecB-like putative nuclease [Candidatus Obscuribacterales bacterium]
MKKREDQIIYSPSDLITFMSDEFSSWMDRLYLEDPQGLTPDIDDASMQLVQQKGNEHELNFFAKLKAANKDICEIAVDAKDGFEQTVAALKTGREIVYQGFLAKAPFAGRSDFLMRCNLPSKLGDYSYEVWDTKLARKIKPYFILQLCAYCEMLAEIQGIMPETIGIILGNGEQKAFRTQNYLHFYQTLKERFLCFQNNFDKKQPPTNIVINNLSRWRSHAQKILLERDDLVQIANIRQGQIRKLHKSGITTVSALLESSFSQSKGLAPETFETFKRQASLQIESKGLSIPKYVVLPENINNPRQGLALLPPASNNDIFFDMEGYPYLEGGLEYLFGASYKEKEQEKFIDFWAHNRPEEKQAFESFIDWAYERWRDDPTMHIYHYGAYEVSAMRRLMSRHGTKEAEVDDLLRNEVFVDLYTIVRQSICLGEDSYSIKKVERLYLPARNAEVSKATESIVYYERWLEQKDGADWTTSQLLGDIRNYNEMDCISTMKLEAWLRQIQSENNRSYLPKTNKIDAEEETKKISADPNQWLAVELLSRIPLDRSDNPEHWRLQELLAYLLNFYRREDKPRWWRRFDRQAMNEEELSEDVDCLAGLKRTAKPPIKLNQSWGYEYSFDPGQETKIEADKQFLFLHDLKQGTVHSIDKNKGLVLLKLGQKKAAPPDKVSIMLDEGANTAVLKEALLRIIKEWQENKKLPNAIADFLHKTTPRLKNRQNGERLIRTEQIKEETVELLSNLDSSYLCIQGPPGSGKTELAAYAILELLRQGKRIGVSSNSHKAIENLLGRVASLAKYQQEHLSIAKIVPTKGNLQTDSSIEEIKKEDFFEDNKGIFRLVGGTAWNFASAKAINKLDYLFVDEAGQVSVAHLLAMSQSAQNLVLLGDQMQLDQPIQGIHPQESGLSILSYLLNDQATVPENKGIFLPLSYRMHPDICAVVSAAVYDGKLHSAADTKNRSLLLGQEAAQFLKKSSGIIFLAADHENNSDLSTEEVAIARKTVDLLLQCRLFNAQSKEERDLSPNDILIVTPYNRQRQALQQVLPEISVGTVDKFQGRQAAVVIISMCASDLESTPRGIEFVLNKNRLNVAISRAQTLVVVIGSPRLVNTACHTIEQMELVDFFCRIVAAGTSPIYN